MDAVSPSGFNSETMLMLKSFNISISYLVRQDKELE